MGVKQAKNTAWGWFSKYIRLRDCIATTGTKTRGRCCTCGKEFKFQKLQAGHLLGGRTNDVLFDETGVHAQCFRCNDKNRGNGEHRKYVQFMIRKYGREFTHEKLEMPYEVVQFKEYQLREISDKYRKLYHELMDS